MSIVERFRQLVESEDRAPSADLLATFDREFRPRGIAPHDGGPEWDAFYEQRDEFIAFVDDADDDGLGGVLACVA